nr:hypothetical protein [Bacteroidota bacterium]
ENFKIDADTGQIQFKTTLMIGGTSSCTITFSEGSANSSLTVTINYTLPSPVVHSDWQAWQTTSWCPHPTNDVNLFLKAWNMTGTVINACVPPGNEITTAITQGHHSAGEVIVGVEVLGGGTGGEGQLRGGVSFYNVVLRPDDAYRMGNFNTLSSAYRGYFAGLHVDTYVGLPLGTNNDVNDENTAIWKGYFSHVRSHIAGPQDTNDGWRGAALFRLEVNFVNRTISNLNDLPGKSNNGGYYFRANYTPEGFVTGTLNNSGIKGWTRGINDSWGRISGIIGQKGVTAGFIFRDYPAKASSDEGYSGGFVACPTVGNDGTGDCR